MELVAFFAGMGIGTTILFIGYIIFQTGVKYGQTKKD